MFKFFSLMLVVFFCGYSTKAKYLTEQPNFIKACKSKDTKCNTENTQSLFLKFKTGIPGLNIPTTDPLRIDRMEIVQNQIEAVNVSVVLTNVEMRGLADAIIKNAKYDEENGVFSFDMALPTIRVISNYSMSGKILLLQLNGHGKMSVTGANYIKVCKPTDIKCLTENIQSIFLLLKTGLPGLKDVPTIDPLKVDRIEIAQDQAQALNVSAVLTNAEINGLGDANVNSVKYDEGKGAFSMDMDFEKLKMVSDYSLKGRILLLHLNSTGKLYMSSDNVKATMNVLTEPREEDGEKFIYIKAVRIHYKLGGVKAKLDNLFNGNKELEESANLLFNESWEELNQAFEPVLEKSVENVLLTVMRRVFLHIPAKFIFA